MKKKTLSTLSLFITCITSLITTSCSTQKYQVDYCDQKIGYKNAKDSYAAGTEVTLYYDLIATDTNYSFYLDDEYLPVTYSDDKGFIIHFIMPEHNVKLNCVIHNVSYNPTTEEVLLLDFCQKTFTEEETTIYEIVVTSTCAPTEVLVEVYQKDSHKAYVISSSIVDECFEMIDKYNLRDWNQLTDSFSLDGTVISCKFKNDDDTYTSISTEHMPENGEQQLEQIHQILLSYLSSAN